MMIIQCDLGSEFPDLKHLMNTLYSYGITGVTEVTPSNGVKEYLNYINKVKLLKIDIMGRSDLASKSVQISKDSLS
jgi:hypothetical protein